MSIEAPKPLEMPTIDYADHTVEIDTRGLFAAMSALKHASEASEASVEGQDANSNADLTAAQVSALLSQSK